MKIFENSHHISDKYYLEEYKSGRFTGKVEGYPIDLCIDTENQSILLKMFVVFKFPDETKRCKEIMDQVLDQIDKEYSFKDTCVEIKIVCREGSIEDLEKLIDKSIEYFNENKIKSACSRCRTTDVLYLYLEQWEKASYLCEECRKGAIKARENYLNRKNESILEKNHKIKKASANIWSDLSGHSRLVSFIFIILIFSMILILAYGALNKSLEHAYISELPLNIEADRQNDNILVNDRDIAHRYSLFAAGLAMIAFFLSFYLLKKFDLFYRSIKQLLFWKIIVYHVGLLCVYLFQINKAESIYNLSNQIEGVFDYHLSVMWLGGRVLIPLSIGLVVLLLIFSRNKFVEI